MTQAKRTLDAIFEGDGRIVIEAPVWMNCPGARAKLRRSQARQFRDMLLQNGHSIHSETGHTLWVPYAYCMLTNTDFELLYKRLGGFGTWMVTLTARPFAETKPL